MKFQYFPGCTLKTKGVRLDSCAKKSAEALGFTLEELSEWQCCGAVYPMARLSIPWKSDKTGGKSAFSVDRDFSPGV